MLPYLMLLNILATNLENAINYNFPTSIAVCVSGGVDSLALLFLVNEWNKKYNLPITILTVNHHLRKESLEECAYVKEVARQLNVPCEILNWHHESSLSNIQASARTARYNLLTEYCHNNNIPVLLLGHHLDDYIENFCLRILRKSGAFGLSTSNVHFYNNIKIVRPLYNIQKKELINYLSHKNIKWFEDASNYSDKYDRSRIRKVLALTGVDIKLKILDEQKKINAELQVLKKELVQSLAEGAVITKFGFAIINLNLFNEYQLNSQLQILFYLLTISSGKDYFPKAKALKLVLDRLVLPADFTTNLHGCSIKKTSNKLIILREFGKNLPQPIEFKDGLVWDNRFIVKTNLNTKNLFITYINNEDYKAIKNDICLEKLKNLSLKNHKKILFTLPVIRNLEKIIAIPHIYFYNDNSLVEKVKILYHPEFISRFIHLA